MRILKVVTQLVIWMGCFSLVACGTNESTPVAGFTLSGSILDADASPLAGATVLLSGPQQALATTDGAGHYSFSGIASGQYTVTPSMTGYSFAPTSASVTVNGANVTASTFTATVVSSGGFRILGLVSGGPPGVTILLSGVASATTTVDASGSYAFSGLPNGRYTVTPLRSGYSFAPASATVIVSDADVTVATFAAAVIPAPTYKITGVVSGDVIEGVTISLSGSASATASTDAAGQYSFTGVANGTYTITPAKSGYTFAPASAVIAVQDAEVVAATFVARAVQVPTYRIFGTVSGDVSQGVTVSLSGPAGGMTSTDANGWYSFTGLVGGTYTITPVKSGFTFSPVSAVVTVNDSDAAAPTFFATTVPAPTYGISGMVSGYLSLGVTVSLSGPAGGMTSTDANGWYSFAGLASGTYTIIPMKNGYTFAPASAVVTVNDSNATAPTFFATAAPAPTYGIFGMVSGDVSEGVAISLSGPAGSTTSTDANGWYSFTGLVIGTYTITPVKSGFTFSPVSAVVTVNDSDATAPTFFATAVPAPTYGISGMVSGDVSEGVAISLSGPAGSMTSTDANGRYSFAGLVNGTYTITPMKNGYTFAPASAVVTVSDSDAAAMTFTAKAVAAPTYNIAGMVSGDVSEGVTISLSGSASATASTDAAGQYSFTGLLNGAYTITPSKSGYTFTPASAVIAVNGADVAATTFIAKAVPPPTYKIAGMISGDVTERVTISLSGSASATASSDANGRYSFVGLANGTYTITPMKNGYTFAPASAVVTVKNADATAAAFTAKASSGQTYVSAVSSSGDAIRHLATTGTAEVDAFSTSNYGGWITYQTYYVNGGYGIGYIMYDSVFEIDLSGLPKNAPIASATLHVYLIDAMQRYNYDNILAILEHLRSTGYTGNAAADYGGIQGPRAQEDVIQRFASGAHQGWWTFDVTSVVSQDVSAGVCWAVFWLSPAPWETNLHEIVNEEKRVNLASADYQSGAFAPYLEIKTASVDQVSR